MQPSSLHSVLTAALFLCCAAFLQCNAYEFYSIYGSEPINFPPNNTVPYVEPSFCTSEGNCTLDVNKGEELKAQWTVKIKAKDTRFNAEIRYILQGVPEVHSPVKMNVTVESSDVKMEAEDDKIGPYSTVIVTTSGTLKVEYEDPETYGAIRILLFATYNNQKDSIRWGFGHDFYVA